MITVASTGRLRARITAVRTGRGCRVGAGVAAGCTVIAVCVGAAPVIVDGRPDEAAVDWRRVCVVAVAAEVAGLTATTVCGVAKSIRLSSTAASKFSNQVESSLKYSEDSMSSACVRLTLSAAANILACSFTGNFTLCEMFSKASTSFAAKLKKWAAGISFA